MKLSETQGKPYDGARIRDLHQVQGKDDETQLRLQRRLRENNRKLHAVENYANDLLKAQAPIRQGVGHLLKEIVSSESDSNRIDPNE